MIEKINIFWFRRDLRINDNHAFYESLKSPFKVLPIFIFDKNILSYLYPKKNLRLSLIYQTLNQLNDYLYENYHSGIKTFFDTPVNVFDYLTKKYQIVSVFVNKDYTPYARKRDNLIKNFLTNKGINFYQLKDHVIFEEKEIIKENQSPYLIFTPYKKAWRNKFEEIYKGKLPFFNSEKYLNNLYYFKNKKQIISLEDLGFQKVFFTLPKLNLDKINLQKYHLTRNHLFDDKGTTKASVYLRFGLISIRYLLNKALEYNQTLVNELIWREFYQMLLYHFPQLPKKNLNNNYQINWENNDKYFKLWQEGKTGFPIIDAAINELNQTGLIHNRSRMILANFLTKILLIDWRWGERYFAQRLLDYEMASNVGNWQWSAGVGPDPKIYRLFNPDLQQKKFDPNFQYIRRWIDNFQPENYIKPIINYQERRKLFFAKIKKNKNEI